MTNLVLRTKKYAKRIFAVKGYYFITDSGLSRRGNISDVKSALGAGVSVVQYRNKSGTTKQLYEEARALHKLCRKALFLVNDRVDIALAVGADGVHLGRDDLFYREARRILGKDKIIGLTVHSIEEARSAQKIGADYLGVSPIFSTGTKKDAGTPCGAGLIRKIKNIVAIPIVAVGGINRDNAREVIAAGADSLCAISAVVGSRDAAGEIRKFQRLFNPR
jgi:thiamine-phosphate pyrophosphorylase